MIVLVNGMVRSGSTWSYNVVLELLRRALPDEPLHAGSTENLAAYLADSPHEAHHLVVKSHRLNPVGRTLARTGAARVVFTVRDPWDAAASSMRAFGHRFGEALWQVSMGLEGLTLHYRQDNALVIPYPDIAERPVASIQRIGKFLLGKQLDPKIVEAVAKETSFEQMRDKVAAINRMSKRRLVHARADMYYDAQTMLYRNHISDGSSGYGRAYLTRRQVDAVSKAVAKYGLQDTLDKCFSPRGKKA